MRSLGFALSLALCLVGNATAKSTPKKPSIQLQKKASVKLAVGKTGLMVDVADNDSLRTHGLSDRKSMEWNQGMLFVFPDTQQRVFWMIDCFFDLDIAYLSPQGIIRDIQTMRIQPGVSPENLDRYPSATSDISYALEVNRGWMLASHVKVGDTIAQVTRYRATK